MARFLTLFCIVLGLAGLGTPSVFLPTPALAQFEDPGDDFDDPADGDEDDDFDDDDDYDDDDDEYEVNIALEITNDPPPGSKNANGKVAKLSGEISDVDGALEEEAIYLLCGSSEEGDDAEEVAEAESNAEGKFKFKVTRPKRGEDSLFCYAADDYDSLSDTVEVKARSKKKKKKKNKS